ncbi:MAG: LysM peptidoglycan-binding domain-containing protein [Granulosicoccus sp.]
MSIRKSTIFQKSCLAAAVVTLSACSTTPQSGGFDLGAAGDTLSRVGNKTVNVTTSAWKQSMYMLGFSDERPGTDNTAPLDEVDLALLEEDAVLPGKQNSGQTGNLATTVQIATAEHSDAIPLAADNSGADNLVQSADPEHVAISDYEHTVSDSETLWDIAKATTGDANNWHILADINDLAPNAAVFPGQELVIPADMVKPSLQEAPLAGSTEPETPANSPIAVVEESETPTNSQITVVAESERLSIPVAASTDTELAVAEPGVNDNPTPTKGTSFKLEAGETLWDLAKRTTGDATNWQAIAASNDMSEKQALVVRLGQKINVPESLIREELQSSAGNQTPTNTVKQPDTTVVDADALAADKKTEMVTANSASAENKIEVTDNTSVLDETQSIKIVEAAYQSESYTPVTAELLAEEASNALSTNNEADAPDEIMVSGTYYPKAIYNDADFSSSLLMRVSPGTRLQVSRALGSWFEVETDEGTGYVHSRDIK